MWEDQKAREFFDTLGFKVYDPSGLQELGYGRYANVVDAMQYERLASRSGPTEGIITRPSDEKQPQSLAWLQCIGSRDQDNSYCSSICCMYATKEAMLAKQRLGEDVDCTIFMMEERAFNKEYSKYFAKARESHGVRYIHCRVSAIQEDPANGDLILHYAEPNGQLKEERFEMVVLATGVQPPDSATHLPRTDGLDTLFRIGEQAHRGAFRAGHHCGWVVVLFFVRKNPGRSVVVVDFQLTGYLSPHVRP